MKLSPILLALSVGVFAAGVAQPATAQTTGKGDISGGYQFINAIPTGNGGGDSEAFPTGWYFDLAGNLTRSVAVVAEFGGNYKTLAESVSGPGFSGSATADLKIHEFMGGVRFSSRANPNIVPFGHVLAGTAYTSVNFSSSASVEGQPIYGYSNSDSRADFALQFGGGVNIGLTKRIGIRAGADYLRIFLGGSTLDSGLNVFRFAAGINVPF